MPTGDRDRVAKTLPAYAVGPELGRGMYGVVWAAVDRETGRPVAIRLLADGVSPDALGALPRVGDALRTLAHPHVASVYELVQLDDLCLIVSERMDGGTLADRFFGAQQVDISTACAIALVTCAGLHHGHVRGVVHGDVKPENLMFSTDDDVLKVTDLGITQLVRRGVVANPEYAAPEQITGGPIGAAADIYSTGVLLYELLTGGLPFSDKGTPAAVAQRHAGDKPVPLERVAPDLGGSLAEVVMRSLSRSPSDRFASAEHFGVAIGQAASQTLGDEWIEESRVDLLIPGRIQDAARTPVVQSGHRVATRRAVTVRPDWVARVTTAGLSSAPVPIVARPSESGSSVSSVSLSSGPGPGPGSSESSSSGPGPGPGSSVSSESGSSESSSSGPTGRSASPPELLGPPGMFPERRIRRGAPRGLIEVLAVIVLAVLTIGSVAAVQMNQTTNVTSAPPPRATTTTSAAPGGPGSTPAPAPDGGTLSPPLLRIPRQPTPCRDDYLGFRIDIPPYVYGSPDSTVLGPCEALDAVLLKPGDDVDNGVVTAPIVLRRLAGPFAAVTAQETSPVASHSTRVADRPAVVIENRLSSDDGPFKAGSRTYTYYVDAGPSVLVGELLTAAIEPLAAYQSHKQVLDSVMASLQQVPSICHNFHLVKCGEFYWNNSTTHHDVNISVTTSPAAPHPGDTVTMTVGADHPDADLISCTVFWGDGAPPPAPVPAHAPPVVDRIRARPPAAPYGPWDPPPRHAGSKTFTFTHAYKSVGRYAAGADCTADSSAVESEGLPNDPYHAEGSGQATVAVS